MNISELIKEHKTVAIVIGGVAGGAVLWTFLHRSSSSTSTPSTTTSSTTTSPTQYLVPYSTTGYGYSGGYGANGPTGGSTGTPSLSTTTQSNTGTSGNTGTPSQNQTVPTAPVTSTVGSSGVAPVTQSNSSTSSAIAGQTINLGSGYTAVVNSSGTGADFYQNGQLLGPHALNSNVFQVGSSGPMIELGTSGIDKVGTVGSGAGKVVGIYQ